MREYIITRFRRSDGFECGTCLWKVSGSKLGKGKDARKIISIIPTWLEKIQNFWNFCCESETIAK